jgi:protein-S-isoprenylcysteine O-methyltransferase Ste14
MGLGGIGLKLAVPSVMYFLIAGLLTLFFPKILQITSIPHWTLMRIGIILLAMGIPMLVISAATVSVSFRKGKLLTTGIYSRSRNPLYAAWILFIIPGLSLFFKSWPVLGTTLITYISFKVFIKNEYLYLKETFGEEYLDYAARVNELLPLPKLFRKKSTRIHHDPK